MLVLRALVIFGLLTGSPVRSRCTQGATTFPPVEHFDHLFWRAHLLPTNTFSVPTITGGYARTKSEFSACESLRRPDCTLSHDQPLTQSIATLEPGPSYPRCPPWIEQELAKALDVSPVTLAGSPVFPSYVSLELLTTPTRRYHGTTLIRPSSPACATLATRCLHTRRFGILADPPPPVDTPLGAPCPWPFTSFIDFFHMKARFCFLPNHFDVIHVFWQKQSLFPMNKQTFPIRYLSPSKSQ